MQNHTQELMGNRQVYSSTPTYHSQSRHGSGDREFSFWCSSNTESSANDDCVPLRRSSGEGTSFKSKHSTLIPSSSSHHCYSVSHNSRSQAIAESRKELMQTLQDLPDTTFELSFQYLVQQQQQQQALQPDQILRVESMDNENFLLKMLFPSSLDWKKAKVGNVSKLSPTPSFHNSVRQIGKQQRLKSSQTGDNGSDLKDQTDESINNSRKRSSKSRDGNFSLGCWSFLFFSKTKKKGRSGRDLHRDA